jgi:hypothetical protein
MSTLDDDDNGLELDEVGSLEDDEDEPDILESDNVELVDWDED